MSTTAENHRLLTVREVAERLRVSESTAYRWVYDGRLPALQLGGPHAPLRVEETELNDWMFRSGPGPAAAPEAQSKTALRAVPATGQSTAAPHADHPGGEAA
jgi:excisionase family DNA binding protein